MGYYNRNAEEEEYEGITSTSTSTSTNPLKTRKRLVIFNNYVNI